MRACASPPPSLSHAIGLVIARRKPRRMYDNRRKAKKKHRQTCYGYFIELVGATRRR